MICIMHILSDCCSGLQSMVSSGLAIMATGVLPLVDHFIVSAAPFIENAGFTLVHVPAEKAALL